MLITAVTAHPFLICSNKHISPKHMEGMEVLLMSREIERTEWLVGGEIKIRDRSRSSTQREDWGAVAVQRPHTLVNTTCKQAPSSFLSHGLCGKVQILWIRGKHQSCATTNWSTINSRLYPTVGSPVSRLKCHTLKSLQQQFLWIHSTVLFGYSIPLLAFITGKK